MLKAHLRPPALNVGYGTRYRVSHDETGITRCHCGRQHCSGSVYDRIGAGTPSYKPNATINKVYSDYMQMAEESRKPAEVLARDGQKLNPGQEK
jgi:hypothetical protein